MDAPVIMLASEMMYEHTGEKQYRDFSLGLLPYALEKTYGGGYNLDLKEGGTWPLEYASADATEENAQFVFNGSLLGYVSLKALSGIYRDERLDEYLNSVEKAYRAKSMDFHKGKSWSYYMLNAKTVIPIHYMIFEEKLLKAAYLLSENDMFYREYQYRADCLKAVLGLRFYQEEDSVSYYSMRACSPHPYQIDTYDTTIDFLDEQGEILFSRIITGSGAMAERKSEFYESAFVTGTFIREIPASYRFYSGRGKDKYLLFEDVVSIEDGDNSIEAAYSTSIARDACYLEGTNEKIVVFDPQKDEKAEGDIVFTFDELREAHPQEYNVLEIGNLSKSNIAIALIAYNSKSEGYGRYYTNLLPGMNAISFTLDGFVDSEEIGDVKAVWLRVYDDSLAPDDTMLYVGGLKLFNDNREYVKYMKQYSYMIRPQ